MKPLIDLIVEAGLADRILSEHELADLVGGSDARRYGLVNRALKDGSLVRLTRGTYVLGSQYRQAPVHSLDLWSEHFFRAKADRGAMTLE